MRHPPVSVALSAFLLACAGGRPDAAPPPTGSDAPGATLTVVYSAPSAGGLEDESYRLLGVSPDGGRAFVVRERRREPLWALDTIDTAAGKRAATWEAAMLRQYFPFMPVTGTAAADLVRFAAVGDATGPWSMRAAAHWIEAEPVSGGILFVAEDSTIAVADASGRQERVLGSGEDRRVSPDRKRVLWLEGTERMTLVVADVAGKVRRSGERQELREPMWSADGNAILAVEGPAGGGRHCLLRFVARDLSAREIVCDDGVGASLAQDPTGATLALITSVDDGNSARWLDAATGGERAAHTGLPRMRVEPEQVLLGPQGWLLSISPDWADLIAVDLASGKVATLPAGDGAFFEGVRATRWLGNHVLLLRRRPETIELVRIDVSRLL